MEDTLEGFKDKVSYLLKERNNPELQRLLDELNISEVAELAGDFPNEEVILFKAMSPNRAVHVFRILEFPQQENIIRSLPPAEVAELINALPPDDRASLLGELPSSAVKELLKLLDPEERKVTLALLGYPEDSVGRIMTPDYISISPELTVQQVLDHIRSFGKNSETIDVIYVTDEHGKLLDDIRIREFLLVTPDHQVNELMDERSVVLYVTDKQQDAIQMFRLNNRVALPVLDANEVMLGIVTIDDMLWIANAEFTEDIQKIGGTEALDKPYLDVPMLQLFKKRAGWLVILFLSEMLTTTAMQHFQAEIAKAVVLALFIPLVMSSGGNSGSQASTLVIQAMALGQVRLTDWWRVLRREILCGFMLGTTLGTIGFIRVSVWQHFHIFNYGPYWILVAATVFFSLIGIVLWGTLMGAMLPIVLKKLKADPASSSAPFVATLVDVTGIVIYFTVAYIVMKGRLL